MSADRRVAAASIRARREERWAGKVPAESRWYIAEPPSELLSLVESGRARAGGVALDLGCGPGRVTAYLRDHFRLAVGLDLAHAAVAQARQLTAGDPTPARYVVAESPALPFAGGSFSLIFERGVLHHVPRAAWPRYFAEIARILEPSGLYQQYCPQRALPPLASVRGVRTRLGQMRHGRPSPADGMRAALPAALRPLELREFPFTITSGERVRFTYGLFEKGTGG